MLYQFLQDIQLKMFDRLTQRNEKLKAGIPVGFVKQSKALKMDSDDESVPVNLGDNYVENFPSLGTTKQGELIKESNKKQ